MSASHGEMILDWLDESQKSPARFVAALEQRARELGVGQPKSSAEIGTDLYHELVARHVGSGRTALRCYRRAALSGVGSFEELSFEDLHARCTYRASWWATQGVGPGSVVCVVLPFGVEWVVSLLSALRLGAVGSCLEPQGPAFVMTRLAALAPQHVATDPFIARELGEFAELVLPADALATTLETSSYTYPLNQICLHLFSPLRLKSDVPVPVKAREIYCGALRDSLSCLALRPGDHLAAPGFHVLQHQPALLFAALICGAAYTHLEEADVIGQPSLLDAVPLRTAGLTPRVRDAYLKAQRGRRPAWQHLVRNPEEACDWQAWHAFVEGCDLWQVPASNLVMEAASAGALLCSARRPGRAYLVHLQSVVPAPGRPWQLLDFTDSGQLAAADAGVYARLDDGKKPKPLQPQYLVLARRGAEYLYGGALGPRRAGRVWPVPELLAVAAQAPFLDGAVVVPVASGGAASETRFVLVGFTGQEAGDAFDAALAWRRAELRRLLAAALGEELVPDRFELVPLFARKADGAVDLAWGQAQYLGGVLFRKAQAPLFQRLVALRRAVRAAGAVGAAGPAGAEPVEPADGGARSASAAAAAAAAARSAPPKETPWP